MLLKLFRRLILVLGLVFIFLALITTFSIAIYEDRVTFSEYAGTIIESEEEVSISDHYILRAGSAIPEDGTSPDKAVTMSTAIPRASMAIPAGNWYYRFDIGVIGGTTPANTTFKVELFRWSATTLDYVLVGTLYVKSDADPASGEKARALYNLGATKPSKTETFMIIVKKV